MTEEPLFWADQAARDIVAAGKAATVATGITPSGEIHIGNLREVATADVLSRALTEAGRTPRFIYVADSFDPLRRVYPFLDAHKYRDEVGRPLSEIPCPCDRHESYAAHFLEPFLRALAELDIRAEVAHADRMYKDGRYSRNIFRALGATDRIRTILKEETGKETGPDWSPFNPICLRCRRMTGTTVTDFDPADDRINYRCECGDRGSVSSRGGGKLTWRIDWPARWEMLGVTVEPFGKDHASRGGSYDTGQRISREVFRYEPPFPLVYEWVSLRGAGDMSKSKGNVLSISEMVEIVPPDVLKYAILKVRPNRSLVFDPGLPLLTLIDEYDDPACANRSARAAELSAVRGRAPVGAPFRHLVMLVQITRGRVDEIVRILRRNGFESADYEAVAERAQYARRWLERFAPEESRFSVQERLPKEAAALSPEQRRALKRLAEKLEDGMTADDIHNLIYEVKNELKLTPGVLFEAIYKAVLGKEKGPRAGFFLASLEPKFVRERFREAAAG